MKHMRMLVAVALLAGCGDSPSEHDSGAPALRGLEVSAAFHRPGEPGTIAHFSDDDGTGGGRDEVAYVSIVPGTVPHGALVRVRNPNLGSSASAPMIDGGLDPLAIMASTGDSLVVTTIDSAGASSSYVEMVRARRPPRVVRIQPRGGSTDVPLNLRATVVFSGPIEPGGVDSTAVVVLRGTVPVRGHVEQGPGGLTISWMPDEPLVPLSRYTLSVSARLRDLHSLSLATPASVEFTTGSRVENGGILQVIVSTDGRPLDAEVPGESRPPWFVRIGLDAKEYAVDPSDTLMVGPLALGTYPLTWRLSPNCELPASAATQVDVNEGVLTRVAVNITCALWTDRVAVTLEPRGDRPPPRVDLDLRGANYLPVLTASVPSRGRVLLPVPRAGEFYLVSMRDPGGSCVVDGGTQVVSIAEPLRLVMQCAGRPDLNTVLHVDAVVTGTPAYSTLWDIDARWLFSVRGGGNIAVFPVTPNGSAALGGYSDEVPFEEGAHQVAWVSTPPNCQTGMPQAVSIVRNLDAFATLTAACDWWPGRLTIRTVTTNAGTGGAATFGLSVSGDALPSRGLPSMRVPASGTGEMPLPLGTYSVKVLAGQCVVTPSATVVRVTDAGGSASFQINCPAAPNR